MSTTPAESTSDRTGRWVSIADMLGPRFAERAPAHDADDSFAAENYAALKEARVFSAHVPIELGGGGASHEEICAFLQTLARYCASTALALSITPTRWPPRSGAGATITPPWMRCCVGSPPTSSCW